MQDTQSSFRDPSLRNPVDTFVQSLDSEPEAIVFTAETEELCRAGCIILLWAWMHKALRPIQTDIERKARKVDERERQGKAGGVLP